MISRDDLEQAIVECINTRNPDVNTCMKLAAFYTIQDHLYPEGYSFAAPAVVSESCVEYDGKSEFMQAVDGRPARDVWAIIDELMCTLQIVNPRLYDGVMRMLL